jgi:hypothetical protein
MRVILLFLSLLFLSCSTSDSYYYLVFADEGVAIKMKKNHTLKYIDGFYSFGDGNLRKGFYYNFEFKYDYEKDTQPFFINFEIKKINKDAMFAFDLDTTIKADKKYLPELLKEYKINVSQEDITIDILMENKSDYLVAAYIKSIKDIVYFTGRIGEKYVSISIPSYLSELKKNDNPLIFEHTKLVIDIIDSKDLPKNADKIYYLRHYQCDQ